MSITIEQTDQGEQYVLPGAERLSDVQMIERKMRGLMKATVEQKPADEGLFDLAARQQRDLVK